MHSRVQVCIGQLTLFAGRAIRKTPPTSPPIIRIFSCTALKRSSMELNAGSIIDDRKAKTEEINFQETDGISKLLESEIVKGKQEEEEEYEASDDDDERLKGGACGFTSEIFKIEIKNIPSHVGYKVHAFTLIHPFSFPPSLPFPSSLFFLASSEKVAFTGPQSHQNKINQRW